MLVGPAIKRSAVQITSDVCCIVEGHERDRSAATRAKMYTVTLLLITKGGHLSINTVYIYNVYTHSFQSSSHHRPEIKYHRNIT